MAPWSTANGMPASALHWPQCPRCRRSYDMPMNLWQTRQWRTYAAFFPRIQSVLWPSTSHRRLPHRLAVPPSRPTYVFLAPPVPQTVQRLTGSRPPESRRGPPLRHVPHVVAESPAGRLCEAPLKPLPVCRIRKTPHGSPLRRTPRIFPWRSHGMHSLTLPAWIERVKRLPAS